MNTYGKLVISLCINLGRSGAMRTLLTIHSVTVEQASQEVKKFKEENPDMADMITCRFHPEPFYL